MIDAWTTPLRLFFFRHGETLWSLSGRPTGRTDIRLTSHGEEQARMLRFWVAVASFSRVLTSPRLRARATCELPGANSKSDVEPDLAEWDYSDYERLRSADICNGRPGWNLYRDGCPNGESPAQVCRRADRLIAHVRTMEGDVARCFRTASSARRSRRGGSVSRWSKVGIFRSGRRR
jgi:broad specificity phosphatase PhoE